MAELEKLNIKICVDSSELEKVLSEIGKQVEKETEGFVKGFEKVSTGKTDETTISSSDFFGFLAPDEKIQDKFVSDFFNPNSALGSAGEEFLKGLDGIKGILESELQKILETLRKELSDLGVSEEEIEKRLKFVEESGEERIDDLIEDFTDEIEEAAQAMSKVISDALVDLATTGEFSAKKIGEAFLQVVLDIISKRLIQEPLEELLGSILNVGSSAIGGSASGGVIAAGVPTFINEQGQEIFIPHTPGRIVNAHDTRRMLEGGGGVVVNQTLKFDTAIKNDMMATIFQASPLIIEHTKQAVLQSLQGRRI